MERYWDLIVALAREHGVKEPALAKWKQRGVPKKWQLDLVLAARAKGRRLPIEAFSRAA